MGEIVPLDPEHVEDFTVWLQLTLERAAEEGEAVAAVVVVLRPDGGTYTRWYQGERNSLTQMAAAVGDVAFLMRRGEL